jgi:hypothetical protein
LPIYEDQLPALGKDRWCAMGLTTLGLKNSLLNLCELTEECIWRITEYENRTVNRDER